MNNIYLIPFAEHTNVKYYLTMNYFRFVNINLFCIEKSKLKLYGSVI